ncbi:unnamed protein product [Hermetia illucens]|uniref:Phosphatidylinositol-glycan biosynthesis class W protein n=1 Tax=Hermetia illucens TaxID=343691 RepID=A0A7R8UGN7_HERIL|nr:uncharacterized protein At4g17910 [Hermetia illucens]CAD7080229.1 unnamed protein product [Hermetia illucens]
MTRHLAAVSAGSKRNDRASGLYVFALIIPIVFTTTLCILLSLYGRAPSAARRFLTEIIILVFTVVFNVTVLSDHISSVLGILALLTVPAVLLSLRKWALEREDIEQGSPGEVGLLKRIRMKTSLVEITSKQPGYVTIFRSTVLLITVVCILAVDFKVFPDYSFKTHKYGFSLMDVGIGLFVCSIAVVCNKPPMGHFKSTRNLLRLLWNVFPFMALGIGRAVVIKQIHYNQAVTEYGEHWNAFLTLGFAKLIATLFASLVPHPKHLAYLAIAILGIHEFGLQFGLAEFVISSRTGRKSLLTANREGIVSTPGFVALQLAAMYLGYLLRPNKDSITVRELLNKILVFAFMSAVLWPVVFYINSHFGVSRRICNLGYVMWMLCISTTMSVFFMLMELLAAIMAQHKGRDQHWLYVPLIMQSINYNGLFFFLMANVLTGMVNMSLDTTAVDTGNSLLILTTYMFINCLVITIFYIKKVRIKFW